MHLRNLEEHLVKILSFGFKNSGNDMSLRDLILPPMLGLMLEFMGFLRLYLTMMPEIGMKRISKKKIGNVQIFGIILV